MKMKVCFDLNHAKVEANRKIGDLEALMQEEIHLFARKVRARVYGLDTKKSPRYPLKADVARGDRA